MARPAGLRLRTAVLLWLACSSGLRCGRAARFRRVPIGVPAEPLHWGQEPSAAACACSCVRHAACHAFSWSGPQPACRLFDQLCPGQLPDVFVENAAAGVAPCPDGFYLFRDKCYHRPAVTAITARRSRRCHQAHPCAEPTAPESLEELEFLLHYRKPNRSEWIGARFEDGVGSDPDGTPLPYELPFSTPPDDGQGRCVLALADAPDLGTDRCNHQHGPICVLPRLTAPNCPPGAVPLEDRCYQPFSGPDGQAEAEVLCQAQGHASLVTFNADDAFWWLKRMFFDGEPLWTALRWNDVSGRWESPTPADTVMPWRRPDAAEPAGDQLCAVIVDDGLDAVPCSQPHPFLCMSFIT